MVVGLNLAMCGWRTAVRGELELAGGNGGGGWLSARRGLGSLLEAREEGESGLGNAAHHLGVAGLV